MLTSLVGGVLGGVIDGIKVLFGNKEARDVAAADDMSALRGQFAAEFSGPERVGCGIVWLMA